MGSRKSNNWEERKERQKREKPSVGMSKRPVTSNRRVGSLHSKESTSMGCQEAICRRRKSTAFPYMGFKGSSVSLDKGVFSPRAAIKNEKRNCL